MRLATRALIGKRGRGLAVRVNRDHFITWILWHWPCREHSSPLSPSPPPFPLWSFPEDPSAEILVKPLFSGGGLTNIFQGALLFQARKSHKTFWILWKLIISETCVNVSMCVLVLQLPSIFLFPTDLGQWVTVLDLERSFQDMITQDRLPLVLTHLGQISFIQKLLIWADRGQWRQAHLPALPKTLAQTMTCEHQFHEWGHVLNPLFYQSRNQKKDIGHKQNTNYNSHISKYCSFMENYFPTVATVPSTWGFYIFLKSGHKDSSIVEEGYGLVSRFVKWNQGHSHENQERTWQT